MRCARASAVPGASSRRDPRDEPALADSEPRDEPALADSEPAYADREPWGELPLLDTSAWSRAHHP